MNAHADHHAAQRHRNDDRLEHEGDGGGDVEMRRVLDERLPGHRQRQDKGVRPQHMQQRQQPNLIQHQETQQHQEPRQHVRDIEGNAVHHIP